MTTLQRVLVRDLWRARWQFLAISLVASLGVGLFQGALVAQLNQAASYAETYRRTRFADVWVPLDGAPRGVLAQLATLPGVRELEGRLVLDLEVEQEAGRRPRVIGRMIGVPTDGPPRLNRARVVAGRQLAHPPRREVLLEGSFARRHGYRPGDRLYPVIGGRRTPFTVAGIVASPEYIYAVQSRQFLLPTPDTFGVLFLPATQLEALTGRAGEINEVTALTEPGAERAVGRAIFRRLESYGPQQPIPRAEQASNQLLQSDLEGNGPFLIAMPCLFLGSAALAVFLMLARWVQAQRPQIGFLRASGFGGGAFLLHYLQVGLAIGGAGGLLGLGMGYLLGVWISSVNAQFYFVPYRVDEPHLWVGLLAVALGLLGCAIGSLGPALQAARIPPAEAMQGARLSRAALLARLPLPLLVALPLRNLLRRPLRSLGTAASVACAVMMVVIGGIFRDSLLEVERVYLRDIQHYDLVAGFSRPTGEAVARHVAGWPGVLRAEPTLELPVLVSHGARSRETVAIGIPPDSRLRRLPALAGGGRIQPPPEALVFSDQLARNLQVGEGALLHLAFAQNRRHRRAATRLRTATIIRQPIGFPVYLALADLRRRLAAPLGLPPDAISGVLLQVDPSHEAALRERLARRDDVALVQSKHELERQILDLTRYTKTFVGIMLLFGAAMALAGTYTATDSVLWERTGELATLRTLGFGMGRLALLVSMENLLVAGAGAVGGVLAGAAAADALIHASQTEGFSLRTVMAPETAVTAVAGALLLTLVAQWPGLRRIRRLDLASVIRLREG